MSMARNIVVIDGHPDPSGERYCHALAKRMWRARGPAAMKRA
jgi:hypothetical protein